MTTPNSALLLATTAALVTGTAAFAQTADERYGLEVAKKNMATFKTADGLKVALVAAEPMIQNPTNIEVDPKGRIWAVECVNYRRNMKLRPEGDRVVVLEDTDGDGVVDKEKTFYQNVAMTNPLGICVLGVAPARQTSLTESRRERYTAQGQQGCQAGSTKRACCGHHYSSLARL